MDENVQWIKSNGWECFKGEKCCLCTQWTNISNDGSSALSWKSLEVTSKVAVVPIGFYRSMKITFNTCVKNTPLCGKTLLKSEIIVLQYPTSLLVWNIWQHSTRTFLDTLTSLDFKLSVSDSPFCRLSVHSINTGNTANASNSVNARNGSNANLR